MTRASELYGGVETEADLDVVFQAIRRDVGEARTRADLRELYRRCGEIVGLLHEASSAETYGKALPSLRRRAVAEFTDTARAINQRATELGGKADFAETWSA